MKAGPGPLTIDLKAKTEADKQSPPRYWGWDNFNNAVVVAGDPGASAEVKVAGAGIAPGVHIPFVTFSSLEQLAFKNLVSEVKPSWPSLSGGWDSLVKNKPLSIKFSFGSVGLGIAQTRGGPTQLDVYDLQSELKWSPYGPFKLTLTSFDTGESYIPSLQLDAVVERITALKAASDRARAQVEMMKQASVDPKECFRVHLAVTGYSSRVWRGARGAADQRERNVALSEARAHLVAQQFSNRLADSASVLLDNVVGLGPSVVVPGSGGGNVVPVADDEAAGRLWHQEYDAWAKDNYERDHDATRAEKRAKIQQLDARYSRSSNDPMARRVEIVINFEAREIYGKLPSESNPSSPPTSLPTPTQHPGEFNEPDATVPDATVH